MTKRIPNFEDTEPLHGSFPHGPGGAAAFDESGARTPVADRSGEEFLNALCARHDISMETAMDIQGEMEEFLGAPQGGRHASGFDSVHVTAALQSIFVEMLDCDNAAVSLRAMAYALELDDIIAHQTPADIGRHLGCTRYNVTKLVKRFQLALKLPKRRGQKSEAACQKMSVKRKSQLSPRRRGDAEER